MKEKIRKIIMMFITALTISLINFNGVVNTVSASPMILATGDGVTVDDSVMDGDDSDLNDTVGKILGIIVWIARIMGIIMIAVGLYKLISDYFVNEDPSSLKRSISFIIVGFVLVVALEPMINAILSGVKL